MSDAASNPPKGPVNFDLSGMGDEEFEEMNALLIRLDFPAAIKPANTRDGGADMVLPRADGTRSARCWQSKHYPRNIRWDECEKSLTAARQHWTPDHYTFEFPRNLTAAEDKTFTEKFGSRDIPVDYWNATEVTARLIGTDGGQRIARRYFDDIALEREQMLRAVEASGKLDDAGDAADRLRNIGAAMASFDPYFTYSGVTHEQGAPAPPAAPGTVMSLLTGDGRVMSRVDAIPRHPDALELFGPQFTLEAEPTDAGHAAGEKLSQALREGSAVEIDDGLKVTFTKLPPGFEDTLNEPLMGKVVLGKSEPVRRPVPPWDARLRISSTAGAAVLDVRLVALTEPPDGWDTALVAKRGGLTVTAMLRLADNGRGEMRWNLNFDARTSGKVSDKLAALRLMQAASGEGEMVVTDRGATGRPTLTLPTPAEPFGASLGEMLAFLEDVDVIGSWAGVEYDVPGEIELVDLEGVGMVAAIIRHRGRELNWESSELVIETANVEQLRQNGVLRVEQPVQANVLGRTVDLGFAQLDLVDYRVVGVTPTPGQPDYSTVRLEPARGGDAVVFEHLSRTRTSARASRGKGVHHKTNWWRKGARRQNAHRRHRLR